MDFVTGVFAQWLLEQLADAGRKRLVEFLLGDEQERAVRRAAAMAIESTAEGFFPGADPQAEHLAMAIDQVFGDPVRLGPTVERVTLLEGLHDAIAAQLAPLEDTELTGIGQSSLELFGVPGAELAEQLAGHLVREILSRGARGGPLAPLANQLNHDATHLQGQIVESKLDRLILDVAEALGDRYLPLGVSPERITWLGHAIQAWSPLELEVHRPIVVEGAPAGIPEYIERGHDRQIRNSLAGEGPRLIVIVGGSSTGKTRAAYEAVKQLPEDWRLHYPIYPDKPQALLSALRSSRIAPRTVIWLNELQQYLLPAEGEEAAAALREYLQGDEQTLLIGTIWPEYWQELTRPQPDREESHPQARALLLYKAKRIDVDLRFPSGKLEVLARRDARIRMALQAGENRITQYIAAGPALVEFYSDAKDAFPAVWAVLSAAMDWCLVEQFEQYPDVVSDFLPVAASGYMSDEDWGSLSKDWFTEAIMRASTVLRGATRPLTPVRSRKAGSEVIRYRLADYLLQHARHHRAGVPIPASFWEGVWSALDSVYITAFAQAAEDRGMYEQSSQLWEILAEEGDPVALSALMRSPQANTQSVQEAVTAAIDNLDMSDINTVGWMLFELRDYPDLNNRIVEKIVANAQELGVGDPLQMSGVLEELKKSHLDTVSIYVRRIGDRIEQIDLSDFWSSSSLVDELLGSGLEEGKRVASVLARLVYERCNTDPGQLAYLLPNIRFLDPKLFKEGIRQLRSLVNALDDVSDVISIHPLMANLRKLHEAECYMKMLERVSSSIDSLTLGSSYAPLEMISLLKREGLNEAADSLSARVAMEFDPGLSGAATHALQYLQRLMPRDIFEVFANRMANEGPIFPVAEAEELAGCFIELGMEALQQTYLRRFQQFRSAEGY